MILPRIPRGLMDDLLKIWLGYNPDTGVIYRKVARSTMPAGSPVGRRDTDGYIKVDVAHMGKTYTYAGHRLAWMLHHGEWPAGQLDHINRIKTDNRLSNLREATVRLNNQNKEGWKGGVQERCGGFRARIQSKHGRFNLGTYPTKELAEAVYRAVEAVVDGVEHRV